jgi:hypothetical protein
MKIIKDRGLALKTYREATECNEIETFYCSKNEIPADTTLVYVMYSEMVDETGSLAYDHEIVTLWLCKVYIFCKCGQCHPVLSDEPLDYQLRDIITDVYAHTGASFKIPIDGPDGFKIIPILQIEIVPKKIQDINKWF